MRLGYERHRELHRALHLLLKQRGDPLRLGLRALCDKLVVHLQKQPGPPGLGAQAAADVDLASFMMSCAAPWMGMFRATRSPEAAGC